MRTLDLSSVAEGAVACGGAIAREEGEGWDGDGRRSSPTLSPVRYLTCSRCRGLTLGRQWWNRDDGYGLCEDCVPLVGESLSAGELFRSHGIRGTHFDLPEARP